MTPPATARSIERQAPGASRTKTRPPRRVSGPARGARGSSGPKGALAARSSAAVALPVPGIALPSRRPRRAPTPVRRKARGAPRNPGIALRTVGALERVSTGAALDRLIRGRLWIGLLAFALIGIVAMQLVVLKLNTDIGHTLQREAYLQRENSQLGIENSVYSAEDRVAPLAAAAGMTLAPPSAVHFVTASSDDFSRAAVALSQSAAAGTTQAGATGSETATDAEAGTADASSSAASGESSGSESSAGSGETSSGSAASGASPTTAEPAATATPAASSGSSQAAGADESSGAAADTPSAATPAAAATTAAGGTQAE